MLSARIVNRSDSVWDADLRHYPAWPEDRSRTGRGGGYVYLPSYRSSRHNRSCASPHRLCPAGISLPASWWGA